MNQVEFPTDNYVGYQYIGPSIMLGISGRVLYGLYLTTGYAFNWTRLESGTDAFDEFHVQHSVNIPDTVFYGLGYRLLAPLTDYPRMFDLEVNGGRMRSMNGHPSMTATYINARIIIQTKGWIDP